jgi:probable rRNA maturation factor
VHITDQQQALKVDYVWLKNLARAVLHAEKVPQARISVVLVTDDAIHQLNRRFLEHDEPTDVLTFPLSAPGAKRLEAEIIISTDTACRAAEEHGGHPPMHEVALYLVHGLLHLCGYDDHAPSSRAAMRRREAQLLASAGVHLALDF